MTAGQPRGDWAETMLEVMAQNTRRRPGPAPTKPCGTLSAWRRHQRDPDRYGPICEACRAVRTEYVAARRRRGV